AFSYVPVAVTIQQVTVRILASSPALYYGDPVPAITAGFSGFVNSQTSTVLTTQPTCTTAYTTSSNFGTSPSTSCSGAAATNYTYIERASCRDSQQVTVSITASSTTEHYGD